MSADLAKKTILFVDDEQQVLDGIRRMLYSKANEWQMTFVNSGKTALECLKNQAFDLVIADMRMPEMTGAELLQQIKEHYPNTARYILSGNSNQDMIMSNTAPADHFLAKPCQTEDLINAIYQGLKLEKRFDSQKTKSIVSNLTYLPRTPAIYTEFINVFSNPLGTPSTLADLLSNKTIMAEQILQILNSSFFEFHPPYTRLHQGARYLLHAGIQGITLMSEFFSDFSAQEKANFNLLNIYQHSVLTGLMAGKILETMTEDPMLIDRAIIAGMLHDIGITLLIRHDPVRYQKVLAGKPKNEGTLTHLENLHFGCQHAEIGSHLIYLWDLAPSIIDAITYHHSPRFSASKTISPLTGVHIANALDLAFSDSKNNFVTQPELDPAYLSSVGLPPFDTRWITLYLNHRELKAELITI